METININGLDYVLGEIKDFEYKGKKRQSLKVRLPKGKNVITFVKYEDGSFSAPLRTHFKARF